MTARLDRRASGVLLHVTSLPGPTGSGDLGRGAEAFVRFLGRARQTWWQMLPVTPPGAGQGPYSSLSAFAGNEYLVSGDGLVRDGLLARNDVPVIPGRADRVRFERTCRAREEMLWRAYQAFTAKRGAPRLRRGFERFCLAERAWLDDYALFRALKDVHEGAPWWEWDISLRRGERAVLARARHHLSARVRYHQVVQFFFSEQWARLRRLCRENGIAVLGDVPAFVAHDSADVWARPELFRLDAAGQPAVVAGVPPDAYSRTGQLWGNPLYRWARHREDGYRWWIARLRRTLEQFDAVRLDHFIGFARTWEIPARARTAKRGRWTLGPGEDFFRAVEKRLGGLPFVAEDLGPVNEQVFALRDALDLMGMRVFQLGFGDEEGAERNLPHAYNRRCVAYTGTHDNNTLVGWYRDGAARSSADAAAYVGKTRPTHEDFVRAVWASVATLAIAPLQDVLGLPARARMNVPGSARGNWTWRVTPEQLGTDTAARLAAWTETYGRAAPTRMGLTP